MPVTQIAVMDQTSGNGGHESCGYHTLKNSLLTLMLRQGLIDERRFGELVKSKDLYNAIFAATKKDLGHGDHALTPNLFIDILQNAKAGLYDFSKYGITRENLQALNISLAASPDISVLNYSRQLIPPAHALGYGSEEDLLVAANTAKLARNKGAGHHVFAIGLASKNLIGNADGHWITSGFTQNAKGERSWYHMDSWHNQDLYLDMVRDRVEDVLTKSEKELQEYLLEAYVGNIMNGQLYNNYISSFSEEGDVYDKEEATTFFIKNKIALEQYTGLIQTRVLFMENGTWLNPDRLATPERKQELEHMNRLYYIAKFMYENAEKTDIQAKATLKPLCEQLKTALGKKDVLKNIHDKAVVVEVGVDKVVVVDAKPIVGPVIEPIVALDAVAAATEQTKKEEDQQVIAALVAVEQGEPQATEGFAAKFVNAIKWLWEGIKGIGERIYNGIAGLVS